MLPDTPIHTLPESYHEVKHLVATEGRTLIWLNLAALIPLVVMLLVIGEWWRVIQRVRGVFGDQLLDHPSFLLQVALTIGVVILTFTVHELIHGLAIWRMGHKPRFGVRLDLGVAYATTDNALFPRNQFIVIALAPLIGMTLVGMGLMFVVSDALAYYIGLMIVINASGAIGDMWMSWMVWRYPAYALVRDEADSIRIYMPNTPAT